MPHPTIPSLGYISRASDSPPTSASGQLAVEFLFESLPQIIIQCINNERTSSWSGLAIASLVLSLAILLNAIWKYGNLFFGGEIVGEADVGVFTDQAPPAYRKNKEASAPFEH